MASEADKVVVELVANTGSFNKDVRDSSAVFRQSMGDIENSAGVAERAHGKLTASIGNNRIAMLEFGHIARATTEQIAAGAPATQIFAQHIGQLGQAITLTGGAFGKVGAFLGGPWGLALTAATALAVTLIHRHQEHAETLDDLVDKLKKHHDHTVLSEEADRVWDKTVDGLTDKSKKLNAELEKRLTNQTQLNRRTLEGAQNDLAAANAAAARLASTPGTTPQQLDDAQKAITAASIALHNAQLLQGQEAGAAIADLTERARQWADRQQIILNTIEGAHPELAGGTAGSQLEAAFLTLKKATEDAASAGVNFDKITKQSDTLNNQLQHGQITVVSYAQQIRNLAKALEDTVEQAKALAKIDPVKQFKDAVIGAEGTGRNRLGSSAAGFGQFMPSTFESYFRQLFPQQAAGLSKAAIDDLRNNREVATAVINAATDDYVKVLKAAGQQITAAGLYTVHLLGTRDAQRLFAASGDQSVRSALGGGAHADAVIRGNPFLGGSVADARTAIAKRIGDSNSLVSQATVSLAREQDSIEQRMAERLAAEMDKEQEVTVAKEGQAELSREILANHSTLNDLIENGIIPSLKDWEREYEQLKASQQELNRFGGQLIDDVLNPDNWKSWGSIGKTVLHDLEAELLTMAAINPLKNLLAGPNAPQLPTLGSLFSLFGGGGSPFSANQTFFGVSGYASGGRPPVGKPSIVGEEGPEVFVPDQAGTIIPTAKAFKPANDRAASPLGGMSPGLVRVLIEASPYFDGRVMDVAGPVIAQSSVASANGGAGIARRNLAREQQHRLE